MEFVIPGCVLSHRARLNVIFIVVIVAHAIAAACIFLEKDKPSQVLVGLLIAELAVAFVWIVIKMVSWCREHTSLRTARSDGQPNTENDVNTKALAKNDDAEQNQAGTKAAIEEEEEEPNEAERKQIEDNEGVGKLSQTDGTEAAIKEEEEEPNEAERKQIEDDEGAGKRSQAKEGGRKASDDDWLNCIIVVAVLLVIAGLASPLLGPAHDTAGQRDPFGCPYSGARHEDPFRCVHGGSEPNGECTRSVKDKRAAHCVGAAASSPPGERVDAHERRRGAPGQN
jgi:hypothetical protein